MLDWSSNSRAVARSSPLCGFSIYFPTRPAALKRYRSSYGIYQDTQLGALLERLLTDAKALADERVNILSASVQTSRDRVAISRFTFELADPAHLGAVLQTVRNVDGVFDVERVTA